MALRRLACTGATVGVHWCDGWRLFNRCNGATVGECQEVVIGGAPWARALEHPAPFDPDLHRTDDSRPMHANFAGEQVVSGIALAILVAVGQQPKQHEPMSLTHRLVVEDASHPIERFEFTHDRLRHLRCVGRSAKLRGFMIYSLGGGVSCGMLIAMYLPVGSANLLGVIVVAEPKTCRCEQTRRGLNPLAGIFSRTAGARPTAPGAGADVRHVEIILSRHPAGTPPFMPITHDCSLLRSAMIQGSRSVSVW